MNSNSDAELQLKRKIADRDQVIINGEREYAVIVKQLKEEKASRRELEHKLNVESDKNLKAQAALYTKTEEHKVLAYLKANLETTLLATEKEVKLAKVEIKRLEHQFDVATTKASTLQTENTRLTQQALSRPTPRASISTTTTEKPTNRFGYNSTNAPNPNSIPTPSVESSSSIRPRSSSAHGNYPNVTSIGVKGRRSSISSSSIPTLKPVINSTIDTAKLNQLEREVSEAKLKNEGLEKEVIGLKTKLSNKEREMLTLENKLMAIEKEKKTLAEELGGKLEDAMDEVKEGRRELEKVKEKMRVEMVSLTNLMGSDKKSFEDKISRMKAEVEKKELEIEKSEIKREAVEIKLNDLIEESKGAKGKDGNALQDLQAEKIEVEKSLAQVTELLKLESGKTSTMEQSLEKVRQEAEEVKIELGKEIEKVQIERDSLVSALGSAEAEYLSAKVLHDNDMKSQVKEIESLKSHLELFQSTPNGEEVDALKTSLDELRSQLTTKDTELAQLIADHLLISINHTSSIEALQLEKSTLVESLTKAQLDLETLPISLNLSQEALSAVQVEKEQLLVQLEDMQVKIEELTQSMVEFEEMKSTLITLREGKEESNRIIVANEEEIKVLKSTIETSAAQVNTLSTRIIELENLPKRTFDDSVVEALQSQSVILETQLISAKDTIISLNKEMEVLVSTNVELDARKIVSETDIASLEANILELKEKLEVSLSSASEEFLRAQAESDRRILEVEELQLNNSDIENQLSSTTSAWENLKIQHSELESKFEVAQSTLNQLEFVEGDLRSTKNELESLRISTEEISSNHLIQIGDIQTRIADQEDQIQVLNQLVEELGTSLEGAEERVVKIAEEFKLAQENIEQQKVSSVELIDTASKLEQELLSAQKEFNEESRSLKEAESRASVAEKELLDVKEIHSIAISTTTQQLEEVLIRARVSEQDSIRLSTELEIATVRLNDSEELLATLRLELQLASTSISPIEAVSSSSSSDFVAQNDTTKQSILVIRLREERDELWSRLKFTSTEAQFRFEGLQERLILLEEEKGNELEDLESRLSSAVDARILSSEVAREVLEKAKEDIEQLKLELEMAESGLKDAEIRLIDFETVSNQAETRAVELDHLLIKVSAIEGNLQLATEEAENLRAELTEANATRIELEKTLKEVEEELKHATISTASNQSTSDEEVISLRSNISRLELEKLELQEKILRRTQQIALNDQTIGLLLTNQLVADDEDDTAELPSNLTSTANLEQDLITITTQLETESKLRQEIESQLVAVASELATAKEDLLEAESIAKQMHDSHQASNILIQSNLEVAQIAFNKLEAEHSITTSTLTTLEITYSDSHQQYLADRAILAEALQNKSQDVARALEKISNLESSVLSLNQNQEFNAQTASEHQEIVKQLELDLSESINQLEVSTVELEKSREQVERLGLDLEKMEVEIEQLRSIVATHDEEMDTTAEEMEALALELETKSDNLIQLEALHEEVSNLLAKSEMSIKEINARLESALVERDVARQAVQETSANLLNLNSQLEADKEAKIQRELELIQSKQEIDNLKQEISRLVEEKNQVIEELSVARESLFASNGEAYRLTQIVRDVNEEFEVLKQDSRNLEIELEQQQVKTSARSNELLARLEQLQLEKSEVESRLIESNERLSSTALNSSSNDRVEELEKMLQDKTVEVEETDEKYMGVLKNQKKNLAQIERLRARCEGLQRDLASLKPIPPTPSSSTSAPLPIDGVSTTPSAIKRKRPAEFDPTPAVPLQARAVVATLSRTPTSSKSHRQEKENSVSVQSLRSPTKSSGKKEIRALKVIDGLVPLKAEAPERKVLESVNKISSVGNEKIAKVDELRAKLAGMRKKPASGTTV